MSSARVVRVKPYPIAMLLTAREGSPPVRCKILKLTRVGFIASVPPQLFLVPLDNVKIEFDVPATHHTVHSSARVVKFYERMTDKGVKEHLVEMHFDAIEEKLQLANRPIYAADWAKGLRIISGRLKGRQLVSFQQDQIRPTTDRVKESQFNILQGLSEGANVLDLFSGTGNLGLEAISRGAVHVDFVEMSKGSIQVIRKNLANLDIQSGFSIIQKDVMKFLSGTDLSIYDLIFVDPPFTKTMAHEVLQKVSQCAAQGSLFHADTILSIESASKERLELNYPFLQCTTQRVFGDKKLSFFKKAAPDTGSDPDAETKKDSV